MNILFIILAPLWFISVLKETLFWTYLLQLKEYRLDRMRAHFDLPSSRRLIWGNKTRILTIFLLAFGLAYFLSVVGIAAGILAILFYIISTYRLYTYISEKQLRAPKFTVRAVLLSGTAIVVYGLILFLGSQNISRFGFPLLFLTELILPLVIILFAFLYAPIFVFLKKRILKAAMLKREALPSLLVVGITGSCGKTSTKDFLYHLLAKNFRVYKTPENINTEIGVAKDFVAHVNKEHDIYIAEMGAYKRGEIAALAAILKPNMAILTSVSDQHLSLFGSTRDISAAKYELIKALPEKGLAIFNGDNAECRNLFNRTEKPKRLYSSGIPESGVYNGVFAKNIQYTGESTILEITDRTESARIESPLLGYAHSINLLGAITAAHALGVTFKDIAKRAKSLNPPARTMEIRKGIKGSRVIDDSYSGNTEGVLAALNTLKQMDGNKKICIFYPLIELGEKAPEAHRAIGAKIGEICAYCIVTAPDYFTLIEKEAIGSGLPKDAIFLIPDAYLAARKAQELIEEGDLVLLENRVPELIRRGVLI